ncbi:MAG: hypothetical protein ACR2IR_09160 [Acidimicrobiia bacterium]
MSPPRHRRRPGTYRPPRDRREIAVAVLCALGVLAVTVVLLFVLRPRDDSAETPPVSVPLPEETVPVDSVPVDSVPVDTAPASPAAPAP